MPKVYVVLGLGALYFFLVFFNIGANFLINTVGFAIPAYYSLDALFTTGSADDTQWLTYWVVYAFLTFYSLIVVAFAAVYKIVDRVVPGPHFRILGDDRAVAFPTRCISRS